MYANSRGEGDVAGCCRRHTEPSQVHVSSSNPDLVAPPNITTVPFAGSLADDASVRASGTPGAPVWSTGGFDWQAHATAPSAAAASHLRTSTQRRIGAQGNPGRAVRTGREGIATSHCRGRDEESWWWRQRF